MRLKTQKCSIVLCRPKEACVLNEVKGTSGIHFFWGGGLLIIIWLLISKFLVDPMKTRMVDVIGLVGVNVGRVGTLSYNSFRWRSIRLFNSLPMHLRSISSCSVLRFKTQLDIFLGSVEDLPCLPGFNNSLDGGDCRWWSPRDGLATN